MSALQAMTQRNAGVVASSRIPAPASNIQRAIVRKGNHADASVAAIWDVGPALIRDNFTRARSGQVYLNWIVLADSICGLQTSHFTPLRFKLA